MDRLKIAIDIDGVVQAIGYIPEKSKRMMRFLLAPPMKGLVRATLNQWVIEYDPFYVTGRSRTASEVTKGWMCRWRLPQLPTYFVDSQKDKPAFLALLRPDVIVDDNPNVLLGARDLMDDEWYAHCILIHDPAFHTWKNPWKDQVPGTESASGVSVVRNLAEAAPVVQEVARQAAALSDPRSA